MTRALCFAAFAAVFSTAAARADGQAAPAGRTVQVTLSQVPRGLESGLPRGGAFGRAMAAVRGREYRRARDLFLAAAADSRRALADGSAPSLRARRLAVKAEVLALAAQKLLDRERDVPSHESRF